MKVNSNICSGEAIESHDINEMHRIQRDEMMDRCASLTASSRTKTRTAQLSGIGYSKEMAKLHQLSAPSVDEEVSQCHPSSMGNSLGVPRGFNAMPCRVGLANKQPQVLKQPNG